AFAGIARQFAVERGQRFVPVGIQRGGEGVGAFAFQAELGGAAGEGRNHHGFRRQLGRQRAPALHQRVRLRRLAERGGGVAQFGFGQGGMAQRLFPAQRRQQRQRFVGAAGGGQGLGLQAQAPRRQRGAGGQRFQRFRGAALGQQAFGLVERGGAGVMLQQRGLVTGGGFGVAKLGGGAARAQQGEAAFGAFAGGAFQQAGGARPAALVQRLQAIDQAIARLRPRMPAPGADRQLHQPPQRPQQEPQQDPRRQREGPGRGVGDAAGARHHIAQVLRGPVPGQGAQHRQGQPQQQGAIKLHQPLRPRRRSRSCCRATPRSGRSGSRPIRLRLARRSRSARRASFSA